MRAIPFLFAALAATTALIPAIGRADAKVQFIKPDSFADVPFGIADRDDMLKELSNHFSKLAKQLPAGQDLVVEVTDLDLAGRMEPHLHWGRELRVLKGRADWPTITFKYALTADGKTIKSGEERVDDKNYLQHINRYSVNEPLRYEKRMLDEWFKKSVLNQ